jgi:hypothetical protein
MNLAAIRVVLRPRTQAEILDLAALWCFGVDRGLFARLAALVLLPSLALCAGARGLLGWAWVDVWLLAAALATITQGAFTVAASRALFAREVAVGEVVRGFVRRLPAYLGALVITRGLLGLASLTVVFAPPAWARVAFVHEACLLEGASAISATQRAWGLARRRGLEVMLLLGGIAIALAVMVLAAELLGHAVVEFVLQLPAVFGGLFEEFGSYYALVGFHAAIPYIAVARFVGYIDQRTRGDGWDIQLRFMALASERRRSS